MAKQTTGSVVYDSPQGTRRVVTDQPKKKFKPRDPTLPEILRLGAEVAQIKASMRPQQWQKLRHDAQQGGYTIQGYLSGVPDSLKERNAQSINQEAQRNVSSVYKPVLADLDNQTRQANALADKRKADNAVYQQWLVNQYDKIDAQSTAADQALQARQQQIAQGSSAAWTAAQQNAYAQAGATPGNVSNPQDSTALASLAPAAGMAGDQVAAARQQSSDIISANDKLAGDARGSALAQVALMEAQRTSDLWKSLGDIRDTRTKTVAQRGADLLSEKTRLQDTETSKAQNNREFTAAAEKLKLDSETARQNALNDARDYKLKTQTFSLEKWKAKNTAAVEQAKIDLGYDQIVAREGQKEADRQLDRDLANQTSRDKAKQRAATAHQKQLDREADAANGGAKGPSDAAQARSQKVYSQLTSGQTEGREVFADKNHDEQATREELRKRGYSGAALDVVMDLVVHGHLSSGTGGTVRKAESLGLIVPRGWLP
jgi:hypothetical protein